jgi:acetyl-CoA C-acetyltransferase
MVDRTRIPADDYDDVVFGTIDAVGPLAGNIGRTCWLATGLPLTVPGVTIDRQCGSSQQALHFAAQGVMSGTQNVVIAGGGAGAEAIQSAPARTHSSHKCDGR